MTAEQEMTMIAKFVEMKNVEWIEPNGKLYAVTEPKEDPVDGDTFIPRAVDTAPQDKLWALTKIQAQKAWDRAGNKGSTNVTVAVIDTGVDYRHKELASKMVPGYNFRDNNSDPMDKILWDPPQGREPNDEEKAKLKNPGHGTHCAGIIGASGILQGGMSGMAPGIKIMPLRFLGEDGSGSFDAAVRAVDFAVEKGAKVISASWGAEAPESAVKSLVEAIQRASAKGVIFVAAAANAGKNNDEVGFFPANINAPNLISVAASNIGDTKASWSNYGKAKVHIASPGVNIWSTVPGDKYMQLRGTSMATPLVSGLVAFLKSQDDSLTGAQIKALMQLTGAKTAAIETACNCRIDAFTSVDFLLSNKMWIVPAAATIAPSEAITFATVKNKGAVTYTSSNPSVVTVDAATGAAKAGTAEGVVSITAKDASGQSITSLDIVVKTAGTAPGGSCPYPDPAMCQLLCAIDPTQPWCNGLAH